MCAEGCGAGPGTGAGGNSARSPQFAAWVDAVVFVFSLEDEISFQTVYNYFLRLCSFRNASEVPMVLVGTQGERAHGAGEEATCSPLSPFLCCPGAGTASLLHTRWIFPSWSLPPV